MDNRLMQIHLFHQYYNNGVMQNMRLKPDQATQTFLDRYRLIARQTQGVYELYYFGSSSAVDFTQSLSRLLDDCPLVFNMLSSNDSFAIITDLPVNWCGQLQYSSQNVEPQQEQSSERAQTLELAMQLKPRTIASASVMGQIAIYPQDLLTGEGSMRHPLFTIRMKARLTHWHYYVVNRSQLKLTSLVVNNAQGIEFESPEPVTLKNGEQGLLFSSGERTFALCETVKAPFNLVNFMPVDADQSRRPKSSAKQLIVGLPIPKTDVLTIEMHDGHQYVYSPMYVYL